MSKFSQNIAEGLNNLKDSITGVNPAQKDMSPTNWGLGPYTSTNNVDLDGHLVTIQSDKFPSLIIIAFLLEQVNYNITATWSQNDDAISKIAVAADSYINSTINSGNSFTSTGFATRKFYKGGSNIAMSVKIRLVEYDKLNRLRSYPIFNFENVSSEDLSVPAQMQYLQMMALPSVITSLASSDIKLNGTTSPEKVEMNLAPAQPSDGAEGGSLISIAGKVKDFAGSTAKATISGIKDTLSTADLTLANNPGTINLNVGGWLTINEAIITSIQLSPSYQMTRRGPLYCDVTLSIETRENPSVDRDGGTNVMKLYATNNDSNNSNNANNQYDPYSNTSVHDVDNSKLGSK